MRTIAFHDDLMIADKERLKKLVELLRQTNIPDKINFFATARANLVTEETARLLKEMNVVCVGMGLESGSQRILRQLKGSSVNIEDNINAIKILKKYDIAISSSFIIGSPDETEEEMLETLKFIKKSDLDFINIFVLTPFPGTPIWDYAKKRGLVSDDMDWSKLSGFLINHDKARLPRQTDSQGEQAIILSETLSREKIYELFLKCRKIRTGYDKFIEKNKF